MLSHQEPVVVSVPELLWHGGGNENGKPDPVYSVDYHPYSLEGHGLGVGSVLCTSGIDASIPPKGSVRVSSAITAFLVYRKFILIRTISDYYLYLHCSYGESIPNKIHLISCKI